jgi:predicted DNA binding CopG/RHH family protein
MSRRATKTGKSPRPVFPDEKGFKFIDDEERDLITSVERAYARGELRPVKNQKALIAQAQAGARRWMEKERKEARTNIRLRPSVLADLKAKAASVGLGYQTYIATLIHRDLYPPPAAPPDGDACHN